MEINAVLEEQECILSFLKWLKSFKKGLEGIELLLVEHKKTYSSS